jgi:hypothetical protein
MKHIGKLRATWAAIRWWFFASSNIVANTAIMVAAWAFVRLLAGEASYSVTMEDFRADMKWGIAFWFLTVAWRIYRHPETNIIRQVIYLWRGWGCLESITWGSDDARRRIELAIDGASRS